MKTSTTMVRSEALLREIRDEFPEFEIRYKRESKLQRAIHHALRAVTFGGQKVYLTQYYTVLFGKLWVPDSWDRLPDIDRVILLRHERVHLRQRRRMGDVAMAVVYLVPFFPIGLAWGRARIEWEAYEETLRATAEFYGHDAAARLKGHLVARFVGPDYGWMWPFPKQVEGWIDRALSSIAKGDTPENR